MNDPFLCHSCGSRGGELADTFACRTNIICDIFSGTLPSTLKLYRARLCAIDKICPTWILDRCNWLVPYLKLSERILPENLPTEWKIGDGLEVLSAPWRKRLAASHLDLDSEFEILQRCTLPVFALRIDKWIAVGLSDRFNRLTPSLNLQTICQTLKASITRCSRLYV